MPVKKYIALLLSVFLLMALSVSCGQSAPEEPEELTLDPGLLEFLDADTYTQRLNILTGMHHRITDQILTTMAMASDIELEEGDLESRYQSLKNCLLTLDKYEISRD